ncbi:unnamed protein product [Ophioblennius macclurei]
MKSESRTYEWRGEPVCVDRRLKTQQYHSLSISEGQQVTIISVGQHVLIEGEDHHEPYVAKVLCMYELKGQMKVRVDWFVRQGELPRGKVSLLGRRSHPQEVFYYDGPSCDPEVSVESILCPVQVQQLALDTPFPEPSLGNQDTLYVKLCWNSKIFKAPSHAPPTTPLHGTEAKSSRSSSKCASDRRRKGATTSRNPAVRKRLQLCDSEGMEPEDDFVSKLLDEELRMSQRPFLASPTTLGGKVAPHRTPSKVNKLDVCEDRAERTAWPRGPRRKSTLQVASRIQKQMSLLDDQEATSDEDEDFVMSKEEEQEDKEEEQEELSVKRSRRAPATPRSKSKKKTTRVALRTPHQTTPSIPSRSLPASQPTNILEEARVRLHVSSVPESLPCRESEFHQVYDFLYSKLLDGTGGCMYISGVPGTGKTATVQEVMRHLQHAMEEEQQIAPFNLIHINGMKMTDPHQAYVHILKELTGQKATCDHAASLLEKIFSSPSPRKRSTVLLVDELDLLWTRKQNVMYNLFDWPTRSHAHLIVVAIANTMDLPERVLINRVASRLGLTRMSFQPYSFRQLQQIVTSRLNRLKAFEDDALQLVSRKVAALSGDARRCLDICRRATEICEQSSARLVDTSHVMEAMDEMFSSPYITTISCAALQEQLFLRAVVAEFRRLGLEEATFQQVLVQHQALCLLEGLSPASVSEVQAVCHRLGACRLLLLESNRLGVLQRVRLNVSQDDILYALNAS